MRRREVIAFLAAGSGVVGGSRRAAATDTLYDGLGGQPGLVRIVGTMVDLALADERIRANFDNTNIERLKGMLVDQFCQVSGGPCEYHGVSIKGAHRGLNLTDSDFNALVEDLQISMDRAGVGYWTQNRFLARLAPMRRDVVTR